MNKFDYNNDSFITNINNENQDDASIFENFNSEPRQNINLKKKEYFKCFKSIKLNFKCLPIFLPEDKFKILWNFLIV